MPIAKISKPLLPGRSANKRIILGEFWVGESGELWTDPWDAEYSFAQAVKFGKIKDLQKQLTVKSSRQIDLIHTRHFRISETKSPR